MRAQVRRLEEQQKRRAKRVSSDTLLRSVAQVQTVLRDALTVALSAQAPLVNEHLREPLRRPVQQLLSDAGGRFRLASSADERECAFGARR